MRRFNRVAGVLAAMLVALAATTAEAAGIYRFTVPADARGPKIDVMMWAPCTAPAAEIPIDGPLMVRGVKDCPIAGDHLPLIVISHGLGGAYLSHHDTAEVLADGGFVVAALDHPLDTGAGDMKRAADIASMLERPTDVKRVIDHVLAKGPAAGKIDPARIGFFGFSRGGYTGLVLAGAVPDFRAALQGCPDSVKMCAQIHKNQIPPSPPGADPRIKAFVIADPLSAFPDAKSVQAISAPVLLWRSALGGQGVEPKDVDVIARGLGGRAQYHPVANSTHLSFLFPCTPAIIKMVPHDVCADPPGFDRVQFHKRFDAAVLAFFRKTLKG